MINFWRHIQQTCWNGIDGDSNIALAIRLQYRYRITDTFTKK